MDKSYIEKFEKRFCSDDGTGLYVSEGVSSDDVSAFLTSVAEKEYKRAKDEERWIRYTEAAREDIDKAYQRGFQDGIKSIGLERKEETEIPDCDNCGEPGFHKAWYGHGKETGDAWGERYYPTGSVILCADCKKTVREWDGEEIWRWTSDLPEHNERRINEITKRLPKNEGWNAACDALEQQKQAKLKE